MYEINRTSFGIFVAEHRKEKGYTQKELAERLFVSDKAVSKWETGMSIPGAALWIPLADLLGVTVTELLMGRHMEETVPMTPNQVESLVKKAISFSDDNSVTMRAAKRRRIVLFSVCVVISCIENLLILAGGIMSEAVFLFDFMGVLFGAYFFLFVKEKLPAYYDENKITTYSNGIFRLNVAGLALNNSNWPHIIHAIRIWMLTVLVGYPLLYTGLQLFLPVVWNTFGVGVSLLIVLGGLFIPIYVIGKKYQ